TRSVIACVASHDFVPATAVAEATASNGHPTTVVPAELVATLQPEIAQNRMESSEQISELMKVGAALREENQLLLRRLYGNKTERQSTNEAQLAFADLLKDKQALQRELDAALDEAAALNTNGEAPSENDSDPPKDR